MTIWRVEHQLDEKIAMATLKVVDYDAPVIYFRGTRLLDTWEVPDAEFWKNQPRAEVVSFPFFEYGALLCDGAAWDVLRLHIEDEVEVLPVDVAGYDYRLLNPVKVVDCLNKQICKFTDFTTGKVKSIDNYAFHLDKLQGTYLFKTPELSATRMYATDLFRDLVLAHGLKGLEFKPLRVSEDSGTQVYERVYSPHGRSRMPTRRGPGGL